MDATTLQVFTLTIAVVGAALGVLNTWRAFSQDSLRLRLNASFGIGGNGTHCILLTMVNLSTFQVTVVRVGFDRLDGDTHMQIPQPFFTQRESLPLRLEPRTSSTVMVPLGTLENDQISQIKHAYVHTACGRKVLSRGTVFRQIANSVRTGTA